MNRMLTALAMLAIANALSCAHTKSAEDCAKQVTADLIHRVDSVLAGEGYEVELNKLEKEVALCVLRAAVVEVQKSAQADTGALAAHDQATTKKIAHAQSWLASHGGAAVTTTAVKAGLPGGGGAFCCIHPGGGFWSAGETDPVTHAVMTTQAAVRAACAQGHLQVRYLYSC